VLVRKGTVPLDYARTLRLEQRLSRTVREEIQAQCLLRCRAALLPYRSEPWINPGQWNRCNIVCFIRHTRCYDRTMFTAPRWVNAIVAFHSKNEPIRTNDQLLGDFNTWDR
jgi:hypothetical protein